MNIKNTLISFGIFGVGVAAGYLVCKKTLAYQYLQDIEEVKAYYYEKIQEFGVQEEGFSPEKYFETAKEMFEDEDEDRDDEEEEDELRTYRKRKGRPIINYNKPSLETLMQQMEDEEAAAEEDENEEVVDPEYEAELEAMAEEFARRQHENKSNNLPYVISYDEYMENLNEYEKQVLYYYSLDRTLCEDDDSKVEDEEELVGFDYEDILDTQTIAWVRNDQICMLYEIHRIQESYSKAIEGLIETPRERDFRIKGRRKAALDDFE